jgi:TatA/E family protein of Tat protein translocase
MGLIDPTHLVLIAAVALIVIGPRRLPKLAQALGRAVHEFREALDEGLGGAGPHEHPQARSPEQMQGAATGLVPPGSPQPPPQGEREGG